MKSLLALGTVVLLCICAPAQGEPVAARGMITLFADTQHEGPHWDYAVPQGNFCVNLQNEALGKASSIETNRLCVILFKDRSCGGRGVRFEDYSFGYEDFTRIQLNDMATSFKPC